MNDGPTLDLSAASAAAMEHLSGTSETTSQTSQSTPPTASGQTQSADPTVELEVAPGKVEKVPLTQVKEWRENGLRQADYTRKTQEIAEMRRQAEQVYRAYEQMARERAELQDFFSDESNVLRLVAENYGPQAMTRLMSMLAGQQQQPQVSPDSPATLAQAQEIAARQAAALQRQIEQAQQQLGQTVDQKLQALKYEQETEGYKKVLDPVVHKILEDNPLLSAVDGMEELIRFKVFQRKPQTTEDAIAAFHEVAQEQVNKLQAKFTEINKQSVIQKQKLASQGIEPPGGQAPSAEPKRFRKGNDIDWKAISAEASNYLRQRGGS